MEPTRPATDFRRYEREERPTVRELYRANHEGQTLDFVRAKKAEYLSLDRARMSVWEAMATLERIVDDSDPDTELTQMDHAFQTAEALRAAGEPRQMILTGLIHDLGKVLCLFGEPQWAVVGDTFPVGCAFSDRIVYAELFAGNPDTRVPAYSTREGIYTPGCGLAEVHLSWGHDEYLYHVVRDHLPAESLAIIRYHSFYAWHREGGYDWLLDASDRERLRWVRRFNPYDLYSKADAPPDVTQLRPFYEELVDEFLPAELAW